MTIRTKDSTLAYFVNQLDNFDQRLHEPRVGAQVVYNGDQEGQRLARSGGR